MNTKLLLFVCPLLLTLACNEKKKFGGDVAASKLPAEDKASKDNDLIPSKPDSTSKDDALVSTPPVKEVDEEEEVAVEKPEIPKCEVGESEVTKVSLLTTGVNLAIENQLIKYEISVLSCKDGSIVPINNQSIAFDLDLRYSGELPAISYTIVDSAGSQAIVAGDLLTVKGSDLFGKTGEGYRHWKTENVSFTAKVEKVILEINLRKAKLQTYEKGATTGDSYLRMGKAAAVKQAITIIDQ